MKGTTPINSFELLRKIKVEEVRPLLRMTIAGQLRLSPPTLIQIKHKVHLTGLIDAHKDKSQPIFGPNEVQLIE